MSVTKCIDRKSSFKGSDLVLLGCIYNVEYEVNNFYNASDAIDADDKKGIGLEDTIIQ